MSDILDNLIFDRTQADIELLTKKAYIDYADLNRVETAIKWVSYLLNRFGYKNITKNKTNWAMNDFRTEKDMERIRLNLNSIRSAFFAPVSTPLTPAKITYTSIWQANAIEQIIYDIGMIAESIEPGLNHLSFNLGSRGFGNRSIDI